jgi:hypothetical protein
MAPRDDAAFASSTTTRPSSTAPRKAPAADIEAGHRRSLVRRAVFGLLRGDAPGWHAGSSVAARRPASRVAGSERLGASGRQGPGTSRQPGAPTSAAGWVVSRGRTPEAHLPTGDHARVGARVLPANKRTVPTASARKVRALRHSPGQQAGVEHRVLGIRHRQAVQVRNLSNPTPPTHAISREPPARASEPERQTAHRGSGP